MGLFWLFPTFKRLMTDARAWGWDVHLDGEIQLEYLGKGGVRSCRELRAIALVLLSFQQLLQGQHVQVLSGNALAIAYIAKLGGGGTRSKALLILAGEILKWPKKIRDSYWQ